MKHFSDCLVAMPSLRCKSREGRLGPPGRQPMLSSGSCAWRQVSRAFRFQKRSALEEKIYQVWPQGTILSKPPLGLRAESTKGKDGSHRRSWPGSLAPDGISAGSTQKQLSSKNTEVFWTCSLAGGWTASRRNGGQVVWTKGKETGLEEARKRSPWRVTSQIFHVAGNLQQIHHRCH